jgi:hypothetical protein
MRESLYRVADARAWERLLDSGAPIVHRFRDGVVLREPLEEPIEGVDLVEEGAGAATAADAGDLGAQAFARRQTAAYRSEKEHRPDEGVSIDEVIRGEEARRGS